MKFIIILAYILNIAYADYGDLVSGEQNIVNDHLIHTFDLPLNSKHLELIKLNNAELFRRNILCYRIPLINCEQNIKALVNDKNLFNFPSIESVNNFFIDSIHASATFYVTYHTILYKSPGYKTKNEQTLSGLMILPETKIKGIIIVYHGSMFSKFVAPSGYIVPSIPLSSISILNSFIGDTQLEATYMFASNGYIVLMPDYIGLGYNYNATHPYIIGVKENAFSGIYLLNAANKYLHTLGINLSKIPHHNLFISSFSEGSGYALKATELLDDKEYKSILTDLNLKLRMTFAVSGVYSLQTMIDYMYSDVETSTDSKKNTKWNTVPSCANDGPELCHENHENFTNLASLKLVLLANKSLYGIYFLTSLSAYYDQYKLENLLERNVYIMEDCLSNFIYAQYIIIKELIIYKCRELYPLLKKFETIEEVFNGETDPPFIYNIILSTILNTFKFAKFNEYSNVNYVLSKDDFYYNNAYQFSDDAWTRDEVFISRLKNDTDTYNLKLSSPVEILSLKFDSAVPNKNSKLACDKVNGIKVKSPNDLICKQLDNTKLWSAFSNYNISYLEHSQSERFFLIHEVQVMNNIKD